MLSRLDLLFLFFSGVIFAFGMRKNYLLWKRGQLKGQRENKKVERIGKVLSYIFIQRKIFEDLPAGILHLFVFWGFIIPLGIVLIAQFKLIFIKPIATAISLSLDLIGFFAIIGTLGLLRKSIVNRTELGKKSTVHLWLLLGIFLSGFLVEGIRLEIEGIAGISQIISVRLPFDFQTPYLATESSIEGRVWRFIFQQSRKYVAWPNI